MIETAKRVDRLEEVLADFTRNVSAEFRKVYTTINRVDRQLEILGNDLAAFKDEMSEFKAEMKVFKDEMKVFKDEMSDFKDEMKGFKGETNKKWGEMARKMGTMVEDMVAPSLPGIIRVEFGVDPEFFAIRVKRKLPDGRNKEYDVVAATPEYLFINSTKSSLDNHDVKRLAKDIPGVRTFLPEFAGRKIIGLVASLYVDDSVIAFAEKTGFYVLGLGVELMDVLNTEGFVPKKW